MQILLNPKIEEDRIAKQRPLQTHCSSTFVVDITQLSHPDDIKKDMYGKWLYKGRGELHLLYFLIIGSISKYSSNDTSKKWYFKHTLTLIILLKPKIDNSEAWMNTI